MFVKFIVESPVSCTGLAGRLVLNETGTKPEEPSHTELLVTLSKAPHCLQIELLHWPLPLFILFFRASFPPRGT